MRTMLVVLLVLIAACGEETAPEVPEPTDPAPTTSAQSGSDSSSSPASSTTSGDAMALDDRSVLTALDSGSYTTRLGNRIELQLTNEYRWTQPAVAGPIQLVQINFIDDPGFEAWELLITGAGTVQIEATGTCQDCEPDTIELAITIEVTN